MKFPWFERIGIMFIPSKIVGWIIAIAALVFSIYKFIDIDSRSHSVSDTLMNFLFNLVLIGLTYPIIAFLTSRSRTK